ncbi:Proteasome subunit alpha [Dirofilaria immitis]
MFRLSCSGANFLDWLNPSFNGIYPDWSFLRLKLLFNLSIYYFSLNLLIRDFVDSAREGIKGWEALISLSYTGDLSNSFRCGIIIKGSKLIRKSVDSRI